MPTYCRDYGVSIKLIQSWQLQDPVLNLLAATCYAMQRSIEIQDFAGLVLNDQEADEAAQCLHLYLRAYAELAGYYFARGKLMYKMRHKYHYMTHVEVDISVYKINQRACHTFDEESFLGKLKAIGIRCHGKTLSFRIFQRYLLAWAVCLQEHRKLCEGV
jgi:hypothetical protein